MKAYCSEDTADEVGTVADCLYSIGNRIEVAKLLLATEGKEKLLDTILEDIYRTAQDMFDEHCVVRERRD